MTIKTIKMNDKLKRIMEYVVESRARGLSDEMVARMLYAPVPDGFGLLPVEVANVLHAPEGLGLSIKFFGHNSIPCPHSHVVSSKNNRHVADGIRC